MKLYVWTSNPESLKKIGLVTFEIERFEKVKIGRVFAKKDIILLVS